ncbi:MAG: hypothetical protein L3J03_08370 [Desulfobacterales bacterium]|nr:hypothetical protein [Desulfobacterales bacterium]
MDSESPLRRSEFLLDSLVMNSRPFSMERPLVEEDPFPDRRGFTECLHHLFSQKIPCRRQILFLVSIADKIKHGPIRATDFFTETI